MDHMLKVNPHYNYKSMVRGYLDTALLYDALVRQPMAGLVLGEPPTSAAFQVMLADGQWLSIAFPQDARGLIETALWNAQENTCMYDGHLGYDDIRRFENEEELRTEITRLLELLERRRVPNSL